MKDQELKQRAGLSEADIRKLKDLRGFLPLIADLTGSDVFIDCLQQEDQRMFVAAWAPPGDLDSNYRENVEGMVAERENEAAAYQAFETKMPMRDLKAVTQEQKIVKQTAIPILNDSKEAIGALISECDVSAEVHRNQKYRELERQGRIQNESISGPTDRRQVQELYHRVKNHLQMIVSIMNIQARSNENEEVRQILRENVTRLLNMSAIYELLMAGEEEQISLKQYLEKLSVNLGAMMDSDKKIRIHLAGDDLMIPQYRATDVAMVVNELVTNACKHAFVNQEEGNITITLKDGQEYLAVVVQDDGRQHRSDAGDSGRRSLGTRIIHSIVTEKLDGKVYLTTTEEGTTAAFDFRI